MADACNLPAIIIHCIAISMTGLRTKGTTKEPSFQGPDR